MANDHKELLVDARAELKTAHEALNNVSDDGRAIGSALASIAASLIVIAEQGAGGEEEREEHHVH
jgi:hypothetical protein